jgi:hypothetical protein
MAGATLAQAKRQADYEHVRWIRDQRQQAYLALLSRHEAFMKTLPALLQAHLSHT